jgi:hypothetical protein
MNYVMNDEQNKSNNGIREGNTVVANDATNVNYGN